MSSEKEEAMRNNELGKKTNENTTATATTTTNNRQNEPLNKQDPTRPVEAGQEGLDRAQNNQKDAATQNNPQSETGPAETLRSKAAKAEDKSEDSREPA
jgi:hypothetical protein